MGTERGWLVEQLRLQNNIVPSDGREVSETKEKDFLAHMLAEQAPRVFGYVKRGSTDVRLVHSFRKQYAPGTADHGSVFGCTGDQDNGGNEPWWVKLAPGCAKWKSQGPFLSRGV